VDAYRHFYYNAGWQLLETRKTTTETTAPDTLNPECQYVWSQRYIDAPVLRDRDSDDDSETGDLGQEGSGLDERLYYCTDAQMNVTALVTAAGTVVERYAYDPYGQPIFHDGSWGSQTSSSHGNAILYGGYYFDAETGFYHVRNRMYHPLLGRWLTRDPLGYVDGMSLYEYCRGNSICGLDPMGLGWWSAAWGAVKGVAKVVAVVAVVVAVAAIPVVGPALATAIVVGVVAKATYDSAAARVAENQSTGEAIGGTVADVLGVGGIYAGLYNKDIATQEDLNLTDEERGEAFGSGVAVVAAIGASTAGRGGPGAAGKKGPAPIERAAGKAAKNGKSPATAARRAPQAATEKPPCPEGEFGARAKGAGLVENPNRAGSWGKVEGGKFVETARIDVGEAGKPGFRGETHVHIEGQKGHLPPSTKIPGEQ
jgi:RHS repeat-associated protein